MFQYIYNIRFDEYNVTSGVNSRNPVNIDKAFPSGGARNIVQEGQIYTEI